MAKTVLVTGTGGNVGQGILRNIRKLKLPIRIVGCNVNAFSAGNHLCSKNYKIPFAHEKNFIESINKIVENENVDLIIPSTDFETYYLSHNIDKINTEIVVSCPKTTEIYLDKYKSFLHHQKNNIPFADSCLPSEYANIYENCIVKLRSGRGSRGIYINPIDVKSFSDKEYLVQELIKGQEITTAFYVNKQGKLHGHITMERSLENGTTNQCRVVNSYDEALNRILEKIIAYNDIKGASNLQSIINENNEIIPFELNCRISGTNSIRSNFGFDDVKYTLQEYLYNEAPDKPNIKTGIAVRILMDVIYPDVQNFDDCVNNNNYIIF